LLDHSLLIYGSGMSDGNWHNNLNVPVVMVGDAAGRIKGEDPTRRPDTSCVATIAPIRFVTTTWEPAKVP
jgi:hypothetical protein